MKINTKLLIAFATIGFLLPIFVVLMHAHVLKLKYMISSIIFSGMQTAAVTSELRNDFYKVKQLTNAPKSQQTQQSLNILSAQINKTILQWKIGTQENNKQSSNAILKEQNNFKLEQAKNLEIDYANYFRNAKDYLSASSVDLNNQTQLAASLNKMEEDINAIEQDNFKTMIYNKSIIDHQFTLTRIQGTTLVVSVFLASLLITFITARSILRRLKTLMKATNDIANKNYKVRIEDNKHDEVSSLSAAFNAMAASIDNSHQYIESIIQTMPNIFLLISSDQKIKNVNHMTVNLLGYKKEELLKSSFTSLLPPESTQLAVGKSAKTHLLKKDGTELSVLLSSSVLNNNEQDPETIYIAQDISILEAMEKDLILSARQAGMADIATSVIHNVGNVLNSLGVSIAMISDRISHSRLDNLQKLSQLLNEKVTGSIDPDKSTQSELIATYIQGLNNTWVEDKEMLNNEIFNLRKNIEHIRNIINIQQDMYKLTGMEVEQIHISTLIDEALAINKAIYSRVVIDIKKDFSQVKKIMIDRIKLLQVLVNLVKNAIESLMMSQNQKKVLEIKLYEYNSDYFVIKVIDNGVGIEEKNLTKIFTQGFTSKKNGHGFGLHASALNINEIGGNISVQSAGAEQGATFTLILPYTNTSQKLSKEDLINISNQTF